MLRLGIVLILSTNVLKMSTALMPVEQLHIDPRCTPEPKMMLGRTKADAFVGKLGLRIVGSQFEFAGARRSTHWMPATTTRLRSNPPRTLPGTRHTADRQRPSSLYRFRATSASKATVPRTSNRATEEVRPL